MESLKPQIYFSWIYSLVDPRIKIDDYGNLLTCQSSVGPFKNAFGNFPLIPNGIYYWEIQIKKGCHFKIGVADTSKIKESFKGAFSDGNFGYSYYSMGELRQNSNVKGLKYGDGYGIGDSVGVLVDRYQETISFSVNGKDLGIAFNFKHNEKETTFFPAVACLLKDESLSLRFPGRED